MEAARGNSPAMSGNGHKARRAPGSSPEFVGDSMVTMHQLSTEPELRVVGQAG
jgi:hypothetical protein